MNLANENARDLIVWLGLPLEGPNSLWGTISARELAAKCRRRLWDEKRNHDPELEARVTMAQRPGEVGPTIFYGGRRPGYLREKTQKLLELAEKAGEGVVNWG